MKSTCLLLLATAILAGCGKGGSGTSSSSSSSSSSSGGSSAKHISGGQAQRYGGVTFDIPGSWKSQLNEGKLLVMPSDANASGMLEELYGFVNDPSVRSLEGPQVEEVAQQLTGAGATKKSGPDRKTFGDVEGKVWVYTFPAQGGKTAELRLYGFIGNGACALFALGLPEALAKRDGDIEAILASISKPAAAPGGVRQELVGRWTWSVTFRANGMGGSQRDRWIALDGSGRYQWHYDYSSDNPNGGAWGSEDETGTWSATDDSITFKPDRGQEYTKGLVKRNHPKNVNDPMIVLDGDEYVTATQRPPW